MNADDEVNWSAITARCLAYLCLKNSRHADKSLLEQADFLEKLGLPLEDRAGVVGSASLRELSRAGEGQEGKGEEWQSQTWLKSLTTSRKA